MFSVPIFKNELIIDMVQYWDKSLPLVLKYHILILLMFAFSHLCHSDNYILICA